MEDGVSSTVKDEGRQFQRLVRKFLRQDEVGGENNIGGSNEECRSVRLGRNRYLKGAARHRAVRLPITRFRRSLGMMMAAFHVCHRAGLRLIQKRGQGTSDEAS